MDMMGEKRRDWSKFTGLGTEESGEHTEPE